MDNGKIKVSRVKVSSTLNHVFISCFSSYSLSDKPSLPYLEAVAYEVQRIVGIAYMSIFRMARVSFAFI